MSDDFDEAMKKFRREMLGPMAAHMTDEQIAALLKPYEALVDDYDDIMPKEFPAWLKRKAMSGRVHWHSAQICPYCWTALKGPVEPVRVIGAEPDDCYLCGAATAELPGIFMRVYGYETIEDEPSAPQTPE